MSPDGQTCPQLNDAYIAELLLDASPPVTLRSPLREDLARQLRLTVARRGEHRQSWLGRTLVLALAGMVSVLVLAYAALVFSTTTQLPATLPPTMVPATALLEIRAGTVSLRSSGQPATTLQPGDRARLQQGDVIETASEGRALVTYFAGQTTEMGAQTRLEIVQVASDGQQTTEVAARLGQGSIVNRVSTALGATSSFAITTPSLVATAHGTEFRMIVLSSTKTYLAADQGQVQVATDGKQVVVHAGEQLLAVAGQELTVGAQPVAQAMYTVQPGDTLWKIASPYGLTAQALVDANPWIANPDLILPGWEVLIPKK